MPLFLFMIPYQTKTKKLSGTSYSEVRKHAMQIFNEIKRKSKRRPYIRSAYFNKQKIFFDYFWEHMHQKSPKERYKRLKYFSAAIQLISYCRNEPASKPNPNKPIETLHRFAGLTDSNDLFYVQIKEDKKAEKKYFMSCFPPE